MSTLDLGQRKPPPAGRCRLHANLHPPLSELIMPLIRETVELLVQAAGACQVPDDLRGLRDREWKALRFLACANRFSKSPTAVADYIGTTRATASQIIKTLEEKLYVVREPAPSDKRSVMLCVTPEGNKLLAQHDPISGMANAIATLVAEDRLKLRNALNEILNRIDAPRFETSAGRCSDCIFLRRSADARLNKARTDTQFRCRLHRAQLTLHETEQLCTSFERASRD
ncbi:MarR family winged helix-turn-helix transcriptional regulator [Bradyrhizobium guangzhouense]|uniref:MarR family winged helix-turn-helix transcriptional regulator n=1 Tax=Bradyrhizobium guangzhouense TaxID=1325095 RepID=UPI003221CC24